MCGVTAYITQQPGSGQAVKPPGSPEQTLDSSLDSIKHRGPDARGQWISADSRVGFGHVRLSIVDLSPEGNQPFHDSRGEVHAVVNGELYGHESYREALAEEYDFKGHSDCEIVIALYQHYGISFLSHLRGEFALVLWDEKRQLFFAARDRYGVKSLYYTLVNGQLLVATEMKAFLSFGWQPEWCVRNIREGTWQGPSATFFKGVYKVKPGNYLISRNYGPVEQVLYWDLEYPNKTNLETRTEEEMISGVRERLIEAVRIRLRADVPVGVFLSGGIDSSAIAGIVAHLIREEGARLGSDSSKDVSRLECFTVQFDKDSGVDESGENEMTKSRTPKLQLTVLEIARRTTEWLGVEFHPIHMDESAMASRLEDVVWYSECPLPDVNGMGRLAMAQKAHERGFKVVLTGEGSDEHFAGYDLLRPDSLLEPDESWPSSQSIDREAVLKSLGLEEKTEISTFTKKNDRAVTSATARRMFNSTVLPEYISLSNRVQFASWTDRYADIDPLTALAESFDGRVRDAMASKWHPLHTIEYTWTKTLFQQFILRYIGDNIDLVHHVESRPPFLDHHLTEYVNTIPPSLKMKYSQEQGFREKYILREAAKPFITEEIYNRRKQSYLGPCQYTEDGPVYRTLKHLLTRENVEALGFVDWAQTEQTIDKAITKRDPTAFRAVFIIAQFVVLSQRFNVRQAQP